MAQSDEILRAYMEKILALKREREQGELSDDDLRQIALESGMTHEDLAFAEQRLGEHLARGESYVRYGNWDGAIDELEQAETLAPTNPTVLSALALAHLNRWRAERRDSDREGARVAARRCLAVDPTNDIVLRVISELEAGSRPAAPHTGPAAAPTRSRRALVVAVAVLVAGLAAGVAMMMRQDGPSTTPAVSQPEMAKPELPLPIPPEPPTPPGGEASREKPAGLGRRVMKFGEEGIGAGMFTDARLIAVDQAGKIYVCEYEDGRVQVFDSAGTFVTQWKLGDNVYVQSMAVDRKGTLYAVFGGAIKRYDAATGKPLGDVAYAGGRGFIDVAPTAEGGLIAAWDGHYRGGLLINPKSKDAIVRFGPSGRAEKTWKGAVSSASGGFEMRVKVVQDGQGFIYALGAYGAAVLKFKPDGTFADKIGSRGEKPGQFRSPRSLAVDGKGRLFVLDMSALLVYDSGGGYLGQIDIEGSADDIVVTDRGDVFVVFRHRVEKFVLQ